MDDGQVEGGEQTAPAGGEGEKKSRNGAGHVIPIGQAAAKRAKKRAIDQGVQQMFRSVLTGKPAFWPKSPRKFEVIVDPRGVRMFVEVHEKTGVCHYVAVDAPVAELVRYSIEDLREIDAKGELELTVQAAEKIVWQWAYLQPGFDLKKVQPVRTKSEPGLCWQRLDFDLTPGNTPTFDELFDANKVSNITAIKQWIGSLFDPDSPRQQYVFLWGDGLDGKGSLLYFLSEIFGSTYKTEIPSTNQFWTYGLLGKRVIGLDDLSEKDVDFLKSGTFKGLTGGGKLRVEEKKGATFDGDFICKIIVTSNYKPKLDRSKADLRRIIYSEFEARDVAPTEEFKKTLVKEAPHFLYNCRQEYLKITAGGWILDDKNKLDEALDAHDERFHSIYEKYFQPIDVENPPADTVRIEAVKMRYMLEKEHIYEAKEQGRFKSYLERKFKVKKRQPVRGGTWYYCGIAFEEGFVKENAQGLKDAVKGKIEQQEATKPKDLNPDKDMF